MRKIAVALVCLAMSLGACAVGPDFTPPVPPAVERYTYTPLEPGAIGMSGGELETPQHVLWGQDVAWSWWSLFQNQELSDMVQLALQGNQTLEASAATLAGARAAIREATAAFYPQIDATAKYQHSKTGNSPSLETYAVGGTASYLVDAFGVTRRTAEKQQALADMSLYQLGASQLTITGNVVTQAVTMAAVRAQLEVVREVIANDERNLQLVQRKYEAGKTARLDVLTAESQLAADRIQLAPLQQQLSASRHALSVLAGRFPAAWTPPEFTLQGFALPLDLPVSVPSELVHKRPDIRAAEAQLHAASAAIGFATAQMYPSVTLTGSLGAQALTSDSLFTPASSFWALASGLAAPVFHGGALKARRDEAVAAFKSAGATYQQTVLLSFGQVADVLWALQHDAQQLAAQQQALKSAEEALALQTLSFDAGKTDLLHLLDAQRSYQQARLGVVRAMAQRLLDTTQLFLAMGGGWDPQHIVRPG